MRTLIIVSILFFAFFVNGLYLTQFHIAVLPDQLERENQIGFYDYRGQTNVHSTIGIGSGTPEEVIRAAQDATNDFIIFTDMNDFTQNFAAEGYHRQTLAMVAGQYNYVDSHLIFLDVSHHHHIENFGQAQVVLADQLSQSIYDKSKDIVILAHPLKMGYSWSGPYPSGLDGMEIINLKEMWQNAWQKSRLSFLWSALMYPFNSQLALLRLYSEPKEEIELWDKLNSERKVIGFAGSDASARTGQIGNFSLKFPSYQVMFNLLSNHVLLSSELIGNFEGDRNKIMNALRAGQFYMSLDILGNPKGFTSFIEDAERNTFFMGTELHYRAGLKLVTHLPKTPIVDFEVAVIKDGVTVKTFNSADSRFDIPGKGVYRVIVRVIPTLPLPDGRRWLTWIYTNPFYVY